MATHTGPRATLKLRLQRLASSAIDNAWTAAELAKQAGCSAGLAERYLSQLARVGEETTQREVLTLADSYRSTLELTAARSREYLQSISHLDLDSLDRDQRSLRKDALSSLTSLSSMLRLEVSASPETPRQLGNL